MALMQITLSFLTALLLTLIIELSVAFLVQFRTKKELFAVVIVNIITNPLLNFVILCIRQTKIIRLSLPLVLFLEALVVLVEFGILCLILRQEKKKLFILSLSMNVISFAIGVLLFGF